MKGPTLRSGRAAERGSGRLSGGLVSARGEIEIDVSADARRISHVSLRILKCTSSIHVVHGCYVGGRNRIPPCLSPVVAWMHRPAAPPNS